MKKGLLIICDSEEAYARRLMEYLNRRERLFEICIFTGLEVLLDYMAVHRADILLIEEGLMDERVEELMPGSIILLSESSMVKEGGSYAVIYKLQPAEAIEREVMNCYGQGCGGVAVEAVAETRIHLWGVFSPVGGCGKTTFALALGRLLSRERSVLYLNMESFGSLLSEGKKGGMTDLLYYVKERKENLFLALSSLVEEKQGLDCILPVDCCMDLETLAEADIDYLLASLAKSRYEIVILDIGFLNPAVFYLLSCCSRIFMPRRKEENPAKTASLERSFRMENREEILERMESFLVPNVQGMEMERFLWSLIQEE